MVEGAALEMLLCSNVYEGSNPSLSVLKEKRYSSQLLEGFLPPSRSQRRSSCCKSGLVGLRHFLVSQAVENLSEQGKEVDRLKRAETLVNTRSISINLKVQANLNTWQRSGIPVGLNNYYKY